MQQKFPLQRGIEGNQPSDCSKRAVYTVTQPHHLSVECFSFSSSSFWHIVARDLGIELSSLSKHLDLLTTL